MRSTAFQESPLANLSVFMRHNGHNGDNFHNEHDFHNGHNGRNGHSGDNFRNGSIFHNGHNGDSFHNGHNFRNRHIFHNGHDGKYVHYGNYRIMSIMGIISFMEIEFSFPCVMSSRKTELSFLESDITHHMLLGLILLPYLLFFLDL